MKTTQSPDLSITDQIDRLHEDNREKFIDFLAGIKSANIDYRDIAYYGWLMRRKYESSQADVQLQKRLRKLGK